MTSPNPSEPIPTAASGARLFFVTSLVFLSLACLMLAGRPGFLATPALSGHGLSWLILLIFGAGFSGVFGLVYWAIPVAFNERLYSEKFVLLHYGFHLVGTLFVILSVLWPGLARAEMGMTFVACGALALGVNLIGTFRAPAKPDIASAYIAATVLWLLLAAFFGLPFLSDSPIEILQGRNWSEAWLILSIGGILMNIPMGLALRITPAALRIDPPNSSAGWYALFLSNGALAWMFPAVTFATQGFLILCAGIYLVGVLIHFAAFFAIIQSRKTATLPWDSKILLTAFSLIPVSAAFLILAAWERFVAVPVEEIPGVPAPVVEPTGSLPVAFLPVDGALALTSLFAIAIPALVALGFQLIEIERNTSSDAPTSKRHLSEQILLAAYFNFATGVLLVIPGAWVSIEQMLSLGSLFLLVGSLGFLGNYFFASSRKSLNESPSFAGETA